MINTEKVIGFYTDAFGNEIDEYEQTYKYSVCYKGALFEGDTDEWNEIGFDSWEKAKETFFDKNALRKDTPDTYKTYVETFLFYVGM